MKSIRLSSHAISYMAKRGFSIDEVEKAIRNSLWKPAELGRLQCHMNFPFNNEWNGIIYRTKQVRPIFVEEINEIIVVTVYTYYF